MTDVKKDIIDKQKEIAKLEKETKDLEKLQELYPDLQKHTFRWGRVRYCSKTVNSKCTHYDLSHNCGCCSDSPLELWTYIETEYGKVYSDPTGIMIGENFDYSEADRPYNDWDDRLRGYKIPECIIEELRVKFEKDEDIIKEIIRSDYEDEEDED